MEQHTDGTPLNQLCVTCFRSGEDVKTLSPVDFNVFCSIAGKKPRPSLMLCVICIHLVRKCSSFVEQCKRADEVLTSICCGQFDLPKQNALHNFVTVQLQSSEYEPVVKDDDDVFGDHYDDDEIPLSMFNSIKEINEDLSDIEVKDELNAFIEPLKLVPLKEEATTMNLSGIEVKDEELNILIEPLKLVSPEEKTTTQDVISVEIREDYLNEFVEPLHLRDLKSNRKQNSVDTKPQNGAKCKVDKKSPLKEGFSSRMVQETEEYNVIKLSKEEVLYEMLERKKSECEKCVRGFNFEDVLNNHMGKHSKDRGPFVCDICEQYCPSAVSFRGHMKSHTTRYKCKVCGQCRISRQHLIEHFTNTHAPDSVKYNCQLCDFVTDKRTVIQRHIRSHKGSANHSCDKCGQTFKNIESLRVHTKRHDESSMLHCKQCKAKFVFQSLLQKHYDTVHSKNDYYCVECDVKFKSEFNLKLHFKKAKAHCGTPSIRKHSTPRSQRRPSCNNGVASHACHICSKVFTRPSCNNGVASHTCHICSKLFGQKSVLVRHMRVHSGERPFECDQCKVRFAQRATRDTHVALVHLKVQRGKKTES